MIWLNLEKMRSNNMDFMKKARKLKKVLVGMRSKVAPMKNKGVSGLKQLFANNEVEARKEVQGAAIDTAASGNKIYEAGERARKGLNDGDIKAVDAAAFDKKTAEDDLAAAKDVDLEQSQVVKDLASLQSGDVSNISTEQLVKVIKEEPGVNEAEAMAEISPEAATIQEAAVVQRDIEEGESVQEEVKVLAEGQEAEIEAVIGELAEKEAEEKKKEEGEETVIGLSGVTATDSASPASEAKTPASVAKIPASAATPLPGMGMPKPGGPLGGEGS
jgi:hypothetical protein